MTDVRFLPAGDRALVVEFGDTIERALSERVLRLATRLRELRLQGVVEMLQTELARYMGMCGRPTLAAVDSSLVRVHAALPPEKNPAPKTKHV